MNHGQKEPIYSILTLFQSVLVTVYPHKCQLPPSLWPGLDVDLRDALPSTNFVDSTYLTEINSDLISTLQACYE